MTALDPRRYLFALKGMGIRTYAFEREVARSEPAGEDAGLAWTDIELRVKACTKCELSKTRRTVVFGEGSPKADLVFVGEAPGEEDLLEDVQPVETPGFEVVPEVVAEQPVIHEGLVLLVLEVRRDDRLKEIRILLVQEEA